MIHDATYATLASYHDMSPIIILLAFQIDDDLLIRVICYNLIMKESFI